MEILTAIIVITCIIAIGIIIKIYLITRQSRNRLMNTREEIPEGGTSYIDGSSDSNISFSRVTDAREETFEDEVSSYTDRDVDLTISNTDSHNELHTEEEESLGNWTSYADGDSDIFMSDDSDDNKKRKKSRRKSKPTVLNFRRKWRKGD